MKLLPNHNSDRAWMWSTFADFSEEQPREELLAIRFLNAESKFLLNRIDVFSIPFFHRRCFLYALFLVISEKSSAIGREFDA